MKLLFGLGPCFHRWNYWDIYHDCSDISFWSSGSVSYRKCKDCGYVEEKTHQEWKKSFRQHLQVGDS